MCVSVCAGVIAHVWVHVGDCSCVYDCVCTCAYERVHQRPT